MNIKIKVTKEILRRSMDCDKDMTSNCAIAMAVIDIMPTAEVCTALDADENRLPIEVSGHSDYVICLIKSEKPLLFVRTDLPQEACDFIDTFDDLSPRERLKMPELEFEVELTDEMIDVLPINIDEAISIIQNSETLELVESD